MKIFLHKSHFFYLLTLGITNLFISFNLFALDIAVIGAGASGITAALELKKQGHRAIVLEKSNRIGGLVETIIIDGEKVELGAILVTPAYDEIISLANSVGMRAITWPTEVWIKTNNESFIPFKESLDLKNPQVLNDVIRLGRILKNESALQKEMLGPVSKQSLLLPLTQFAQTENVTNALRSTILPLTLSGYSFPDEIPALYAFKLGQRYGKPFAKAMFRHQILGQRFNYIPGVNYFKEGFSELWRRLARSLDVRFNHEVEEIFETIGPNGKKLAVKIKNNGAMLFDKVIVATHPNASRDFLGQRFTKFHNIANKMKSMRYRVSVILTPHFYGKHKSFLFEKSISSSRGENHVLGIMNFFNNPHLFIAYQNLAPNISWEEADVILKNDLKHELAIQNIQILKQKEWDYFPHLPIETINNESLSMIEEMQGQGGVYHVGAAWNFESTESAVQNALYVTRKWFAN